MILFYEKRRIHSTSDFCFIKFSSYLHHTSVVDLRGAARKYEDWTESFPSTSLHMWSILIPNEIMIAFTSFHSSRECWALADATMTSTLYKLIWNIANQRNDKFSIVVYVATTAVGKVIMKHYWEIMRLVSRSFLRLSFKTITFHHKPCEFWCFECQVISLGNFIHVAQVSNSNSIDSKIDWDGSNNTIWLVSELNLCKWKLNNFAVGCLSSIMYHLSLSRVSSGSPARDMKTNKLENFNHRSLLGFVWFWWIVFACGFNQISWVDWEANL